MKIITTLVLSAVIFYPATLFAGKVELTTYYPAPYGEYSELSASKAFLPPRMTTAQRDAISSPVEGMIIYNMTLHGLEVRTDTGWSSVGGGSFGVWQELSFGVNYLAATDGIVVAWALDKVGACSDGHSNTELVGGTSGGTKAHDTAQRESDVDYASITMPVKKGDSWLVKTWHTDCTDSESVYWIPLQ